MPLKTTPTHSALSVTELLELHTPGSIDKPQVIYLLYRHDQQGKK